MANRAPIMPLAAATPILLSLLIVAASVLGAAAQQGNCTTTGGTEGAVTIAYYNEVNITATIDGVESTMDLSLCFPAEFAAGAAACGLGFVHDRLDTNTACGLVYDTVATPLSFDQFAQTASIRYVVGASNVSALVHIKCIHGLDGLNLRSATRSANDQLLTLNFESEEICPGYQPGTGSPIPTIPTPSGSPIPTGVPTPSGGPIPTGIPTPSPRGTPPQNSAYITFTSSVSYSTAESRVTSALCGGSCNSNMPVTISGMTPEQTTGVEWTATFNDSSLLYNMLAVPLDRLVYYDMVEVYPGELPAISERGENQLRVQRRTSSYTSFDPFRWSVASSFLGDTTRWREIKLVNATYENCPRWGSSGCDMTFVVSFETLSPQVELAGINWERAENYRTVVSLKITNATYYPDPHADLDETSARRLGNRVELQFTYSSGSIMYYNHFATLVRSAIVADVTVEPQVTDLDASSIMLVRANVTSTGLHSTEQRYIISFPRAAQQEKLLAMHEAGTLQTYLSSVTLNEVQRAASPPGADGDGDKKKTSRAALIGGVIAAVVVVLVIVAIVGKKQTGTGTKGAPLHDRELLHTPSNTV